MSKSTAERKREQRERDKLLGIKQINIRVHVDDEKMVIEYAQFLLQKRLESACKCD